MKKTALFFVIICAGVGALSQNVGIGTAAPSEKLHVNGNINLQGNLKVNGVAGQSGQVLKTNEAGQTVWENAGAEYKRVVSFYENGVWIVPAGVTSFVIEAWGGGGGGSVAGGGGSGSYLRVKNSSLTAGSALTITIGIGGNGAATSNSSGVNGGNTSISYTYAGTPNTYIAQGGDGASTNQPGSGAILFPSNSVNTFRVNGNHGEPSIDSYYQISTTAFARVTRYGDGGDAAYLNFGRGKGGVLTYNTTTLQTISQISSMQASGFGAGGGGGYNGATYGGIGGNGLVLIWY